MDGSTWIEMEVEGGVRRKYQTKQGAEYGKIGARPENEGPGGEGRLPDARERGGENSV